MKKDIKTLKLYLRDKYDLEETKTHDIKKISDLVKPSKDTSYIFTKKHFIFQDITNNCYSEFVINYLDIKKGCIIKIETKDNIYELKFDGEEKNAKKVLKLMSKYYNKSISKIKFLLLKE